jgi:uncharacterized protein (DUF1501 family)
MIMPRLRLASLVLLALLGPVAVAAAPAKPQLVAAGATVKEDESGAIVEVRFAGPAVDLGAFRNPDMTGASLVPTTSVDQYAATMGRWLGTSDANLDNIFPNLRNFTRRDLGFMSA